MQLKVDGYQVVEGYSSSEPEEFLPLLNRDPAYVEASSLNTGKAEFDVDDAAMHIWQSEVMENSRLFVIRELSGRLVAALTVLIPHPKELQPWIGAFFVHRDLGFAQTASPILETLEKGLVAEGWQAIYVSPMASQRDLIEQWQACGYVFVEARLDNNERDVLVLRKSLAI